MLHMFPALNLLKVAPSGEQGVRGLVAQADDKPFRDTTSCTPELWTLSRASYRAVHRSFGIYLATTMGEQKSNSWPKHIWGLFLLSLLFSCAVLTSLGWYGLNGNGFSTGFPAWLPGVAAALTLICTIINITSTNPNACEIFVHDTIQVLLWSATTIKISLFITNQDAFGSCEKMSVRSTCIGAQLALWFGVVLLHVSFAKLITAFYVHRNTQNPKHQTIDCEKQLDPVQ